MITIGHYSSNNFQDSTKRKSTEKKTLGYLPRVLFFNAFGIDVHVLEYGRSCFLKKMSLELRSGMEHSLQCLSMHPS
jgi:hypothetical protein